MKSLLCFITLCSCALAAFPSELTLKNGVTLHNATVVRWAAEYVVVKHARGVDPVQFVHVSDAQRAAVMAAKSEAEHPAPVPVVAEPAPAKTKVSGQAFAKGFDMTYRFGGMAVQILNWNEAQSAITAGTKLPAPVVEMVCDADGKFSGEIPAGKFMLYARGHRRYKNGSSADFEWRIDLGSVDPAKILLTGENAKVYPEVENAITQRR